MRVADLKKEIAALSKSKMDKNAMSGEAVCVEDVEGMRDAVIAMAEVMGATVDRPESQEG